jgi:hypothetical protein
MLDRFQALTKMTYIVDQVDEDKALGALILVLEKRRDFCARTNNWPAEGTLRHKIATIFTLIGEEERTKLCAKIPYLKDILI